MRRALSGAPLDAFAALPAFAETANADPDADGTASFDRCAAAYPGFAEDDFDPVDWDCDGFFNADEMAVAVDSATLSARA